MNRTNLNKQVRMSVEETVLARVEGVNEQDDELQQLRMSVEETACTCGGC